MADLYLPFAAIGTLGGTIVSTKGEDGLQPNLPLSELVGNIQGLKNVARIAAVDELSKTPSPSLTIYQVLNALDWARERSAERVDGIVLIQGTDTLEETAFLADLLWDEPTPLIITGAMRGFNEAGFDGDANLLAAVTTAVDADTRNLGVLVVMNNEVHLASRVSKMDTLLPNSFQSPGTAPVGRIIEDKLWLHSRSNTARPARLPRPAKTDHRIITVEAGISEDFGWLPSVVAADTTIGGVVIAGVGSGHVSEAAIANLVAIRESVPVVISTRIPSGTTTRNTYSYQGSESDLWKRGFVLSGSLSPAKARLLLWLLIGLSVENEDIPAAFALHDPTAPPAWMGLSRGVTPRTIAAEDAQDSKWKTSSTSRTGVARARLSGWSKGIKKQADE